MNRNDISKLAYRPCVGVMLINRDGLVWVGRRADSKNIAEGHGDWWQMPQGGLDEGEDPAAGAVRELAEETSVHSVQIIGESAHWHRYDLPAHLIGKAWGGRFRGQKQKWFAMRFLGEDKEVDLSPPGHGVEFEAWRWAPIGELEQLIIPFKRDVYREVIGELGHLARPERG